MWLRRYVGRTSFPIVWSIVGAAAFVAMTGVFARRRLYV
jgi:hypothetical protein